MMEESYNRASAAQEGEMIQPSQTKLCFRPLRADEVEVRPAQSNNSKVTLLLYQDARSAMTILDETLGSRGWQRKYYEAAGLLFCDLGIYDPVTKQWEWKSDTGSKSNVEEDKGLASDAFKRAAVSWGIGRELYTAPRIVIDINEDDLFNNKLCQTFRVDAMTVEEGVITNLVIVDKWGNVRYKFDRKALATQQVISEQPKQTTQTVQVSQNKPTKPSPLDIAKAYCEQNKGEPGFDDDSIERFLNWLQLPDNYDPSITKVEGMAKGYKVFMPKYAWDSYHNPKPKR